MKLFEWFQNGLSLDETRVSATIICLIACIVVTIYSYIMRGDFSDNLLELVKTLIYCVTGANAINSISNGTIKSFFDKQLNNTNNGNSLTTTQTNANNNIPRI